LFSLPPAFAAPNSNGAQAGVAVSQKNLTSATQKNAGGTAQVYLYWPREMIDPAWLDGVKPDFDIVIDDRKAGALVSGEYIVTQVPPGDHKIIFRNSFLSVPIAETGFFVGGANVKHYYRIRKIDVDDRFQSTIFEVNETSEELSLRELKDLRRR
jgi:hypothetical protein